MPDVHCSGFHRLGGRIPWTEIADNPSDFLSKRSRPDTDLKLEEPSRMKSEAVDCWIKHWLRLQKKGKRPLVLKTASDKEQQSSDAEGRLKSKKKGKMKATDMEDGQDKVNDDHESDRDSDGAANKHPSPHPVGNAPASPLSADLNRTTRLKFLKSLSDDKNYQRLLLLLQAAQVCVVSLSETCTNYLFREVTCSQWILPLGCPGSRRTIFFLLHSSTRHRTSR